MVAAKPFDRGELPPGVRRQFLGIDQGESGFVLVFPAISLADGAKVREFAKEVRSLDLGDGQRLSAAGEAMVLADIINMVTREMPRIFLAALISVLLALALTLGSLRLALLCLLPTLASIVALAGLMPLFGLPFNYLNIIVLTVLIGTTVDAGVHLVSRLTSAGEDFVEVYSETGKAILGRHPDQRRGLRRHAAGRSPRAELDRPAGQPGFRAEPGGHAAGLPGLPAAVLATP